MSTPTKPAMTRSTKAILAAAEARTPIYCMSPQKGWLLCGDDVYARIVALGREDTLHIYGVPVARV